MTRYRTIVADLLYRLADRANPDCRERPLRVRHQLCPMCPGAPIECVMCRDD